MGKELGPQSSSFLKGCLNIVSAMLHPGWRRTDLSNMSPQDAFSKYVEGAIYRAARGELHHPDIDKLLIKEDKDSGLLNRVLLSRAWADIDNSKGKLLFIPIDPQGDMLKKNLLAAPATLSLETEDEEELGKKLPEKKIVAVMINHKKVERLAINRRGSMPHRDLLKLLEATIQAQSMLEVEENKGESVINRNEYYEVFHVDQTDGVIKK